MDVDGITDDVYRDEGYDEHFAGGDGDAFWWVSPLFVPLEQ